MARLFCLLVVLLAACTAAFGADNRPIVGILTQPTGDSLKHLGDSYVAASYVKYVEAAGCRAVPVFHNSTMEELDAVFSHINGVFFPGGGSDIAAGSQLRKAGDRLFQNAMKAFDNGDYFPVFGHCMGFEMISLIVSQDEHILSACDSEDLPLPLNFTPGAQSTRWMKAIPPHVIDILAKEPVTMNNHHYGVYYPSSYEGNVNLKNFFEVISTNNGRKGKEFISTMEGRKYPVYAAQWHAEKNQYEWNLAEAIPHSANAIRAVAEFSNFMGVEARKSKHSYPTPADAAKAVFYNYPAYYTEAFEPSFEQCYVW